MMRGALRFLLSDSREATSLRKQYVIRLIPMLNPDGVIYGNYRCSLLGVDLNRRWDSPSRYMHPTIYHAKRFLQSFSESHQVALYCDMHGHSMRKNVFMYACSAQSHSDVLIRLIPKMLCKLNPVFSFSDCHFRIENCKLATARVVAFSELNILNSYTLEASFYGPGTRKQLGEEGEGDSQMGIEHMEALGRDLCRVMSAFVSRKSFKRKLMEVANKPLSPEPPLIHTEPPPPPVTLFSPLHSGRDPDNDEDFWTKVSEFEAKAYQVLYAQHIPRPPAVTEEEEAQLDVQTAIQTIAEAGEMPAELVQADLGSDEGGSDSLGSDNDDGKQAFIYSKSKARKTVRKSKRHSVPRSKSCVRSSQQSRPKTPFVFGNYPGSRPPTRLSRLGKDLSVESPQGVRTSSESVQPAKVLLTGFKRVRVGKMSRPVRVSYCPSAANLNESRDSDSVLRSGPSRWLERASLRLKPKSKQANISPV